MRIVHLITSTDVGGAEHALARLVKSSDSGRFEHVIVSMAPVGEAGKDLIASQVAVLSLGIPRGSVSVPALVRTFRLLRRLRPDLLHCWMYHANLLGIIAGKLAGVPRVLWGIRTSRMDFSLYNPMTRYVVSLGARLSGWPDGIIANSESGRRTHAGMGYRDSKFVVIPNGFDLDEFHPSCEARLSVRQELGLSPDAVLIGLVGRFDYAKDHETFLKAAGKLALRHPAVNFLLCGGGVTLKNPTLQEWTERYGLRSRAHLLGPRRDVPRLTAALDLAVSSSRFEGFCNALGEAMSCGVPCVATDAGDSADIIGAAGRIVPVGDPSALAAACAELLDLPAQQRRALGDGARQRVRDHFALKSFVRRHEEVYAGQGPP